MKIISKSSKYKCPYCGTVVELDKKDIHKWNEIYYYYCPECNNIPHIRHSRFDNWLCPYNIQGKLAKKV